MCGKVCVYVMLLVLWVNMNGHTVKVLVRGYFV